jgi:hypothetical protein
VTTSYEADTSNKQHKILELGHMKDTPLSLNVDFFSFLGHSLEEFKTN